MALLGGHLNSGFGNGLLSDSTGDDVPGAFDLAESTDPNFLGGFAAGYYHNVVVASSGEVWTFGENGYGELGNGNQVDRAVPLKLPDLPAARVVAAGKQHTLVVGLDGSLWSWGREHSGRLGLGPTDDLGSQTNPQQIQQFNPMPPGEDGFAFTAVAAGAAHSVALDTEGNVWTWGSNSNGQLGLVDSQPRGQPTRTSTTSSFNNIIAISAGDRHTIALKSDGSIFAWGANESGQLGVGDRSHRFEPTQVNIGEQGDPPQVVVAISAGRDFTLALTEEGAVWAWGLNELGRLGIGYTNTAIQSAPVRLVGFDADSNAQVTAIAAGAFHSAVVKSDGSVWSWGWFYHQLNSGQGPQAEWEPVEVLGLPSVVAVTAGDSMNLVRLEDDTLLSWGKNDRGQLGHGTKTEKVTVPDQVLFVDFFLGPPLPTFTPDGGHHLEGSTVEISGPPGATLRYTINGTPPTVDHGDIVPADTTVTIYVSEATLLQAIAYLPDGRSSPVKSARYRTGTTMGLGSWSDHFVALEPDGSIWTWGRNEHGELGDGTLETRDIPATALKSCPRPSGGFGRTTGQLGIWA